MGFRECARAVSGATLCLAMGAAWALDEVTPQVMIESRFLQVGDSFEKELGINWGGMSGCHGQEALKPRPLGDKPSFAEQAASGMAGGLLGSLTGGGVGFGLGGGSGSESSGGGTYLSPNPFEDAPSIGFPFRDGTELQLQFAPSLYQPPVETDFEDDFAVTAPAGPKIPGTQFGIRINREPVEERNYSFADAFLVGPDCQRREPDGRLVFVVTQEITFTWSIEFWRWRDDVLQEHWLKTGSSQWEELVGSGSLPLWVGVRFDGLAPETLLQGGWSLVTAWTHEQDGKIHLTPRVFDLLPPTTEVQVANDRIPLAGLEASTRETEAGKVPMLGDIPFVGRLFSGRGDASARNEELLMLVTPRLVEPVE